MNQKKIVGWREWVALPEFGIAALRVKVDTGARTSALHAEDIRIVRQKNSGERFVRFTLFPKKNRLKPVRVKTPLLGYRKVRSSLGHETNRPVVSTTLRLGADSWPIEITLVNRDIMGFRMLLGRSAIQHGFLIDPAQSFLLPRPRRRKGSST